jgi:hypothetical protein
MIKKLLSNAMLSLVMDKQAKEKFNALRQFRKIAKGDENVKIPDAPDDTDDGQPQPSRQELIAQAMAIHQTKSAILDDLTLNEKQQLHDLAAKAMLGSAHGDGDE